MVRRSKPQPFLMDSTERRRRARLGLIEGIVPFVIQFGILVVVILQFVLLIANDIFPKLPFIAIDPVRANDPNLMRFFYMLLTIPATVLLVVWSIMTQSVKKSFWIALVAGIVAWQCVGECSWHFGVATAETFTYFPRIEGLEGTFILLITLPLLIYIFNKATLPWGLNIFVLSFYCNWVGHWIILGIAPYFGSLEIVWHRIAGFGIGGLSSLYLLYRLLFLAKTTEGRLTLSLLLYTTVGMLVEGGFGVGGSLE